MDKIKDFYREHKTPVLIFAGVVILALVVTIVFNGDPVYNLN